MILSIRYFHLIKRKWKFLNYNMIKVLYLANFEGLFLWGGGRNDCKHFQVRRVYCEIIPCTAIVECRNFRSFIWRALLGCSQTLTLQGKQEDTVWFIYIMYKAKRKWVLSGTGSTKIILKRKQGIDLSMGGGG